VAQETVRAAELGRPPRHSTLMACLLALPSLRAADLLPASPTAPVATPAAWRWFQGLFGFSVRRLRIERWHLSETEDRLGVWVDGLRTDSPRLLLDRTVQMTLIRSVLAVEVNELEDFVPESTEAVWSASFEGGGGQHDLSMGLRRGAPEIKYRYRGTSSKAPLLEHAVDIPVEILDLVWGSSSSADPGLAVVPFTRPEPIPLEDADPRLAREMHPGASTVGRRASTRWRVTKPMPGFAYGLRADPTALPPPRDRHGLAATLSFARKEAGLSLRQVASIARTAHASLAYAESGRDCRASTLVAYLRALPALSPQELLPAVSSGGVVTAEEAWMEMRDLYGYEIRELRKTFTISADGTSRNVIETLGLKPLRADLRDFRVRVGLHRAVANASESVLQSIETEVDETRVRLVRRQSGAEVHEFRFPRSFARGALAYTRTYSGAKYPLHRSASRRRRGDDEDVVSGVVLPTYHPTHRASLVVELPADFVPRHVRSIAYPTSCVANPDLPPLSAMLQAPPCRIERVGAALTLSLVLKKPAVGIRYGITWGVPD
jgi:hypothetical protein